MRDEGVLLSMIGLSANKAKQIRDLGQVFNMVFTRILTHIRHGIHYLC